MFSQRKKCRNRKKRSDKTLFSQVMGQLSGERFLGDLWTFSNMLSLERVLIL